MGASAAAAAILIKERHIVEAFRGAGLFYLDEPSGEAWRQFRRRIALVVGLLVLLVAALPLFRP